MKDSNTNMICPITDLVEIDYPQDEFDKRAAIALKEHEEREEYRRNNRDKFHYSTYIPAENITVQPMPPPSALLYYLDFQYKSTPKIGFLQTIKECCSLLVL